MAKNYFEMIKDGLVVDGGGGTPAPALIEKSITANGSYSASDDSADGYSAVSVAVPNSYSAGDEGKVVSSGALVSQTTDSTTTNGTVDTTTISSLTVNVPNTYAAGDEGKVVQSGALVSQTATSTTTNGTIDTTTNNSVVVNVANSYSAGDEGKVVSNGALVAQGSDTVTQNGTVNTTLISSLVVNVSASGNVAYKLSGTNANDLYICECNDYIYIFGSSIWNDSGTSIGHFDYTAPNEFDVSKIGSSITGYLRGGNYGTGFITGSISVSGSTITISFNPTQFSKNINIWTIAQITKSV